MSAYNMLSSRSRSRSRSRTGSRSRTTKNTTRKNYVLEDLLSEQKKGSIKEIGTALSLIDDKKIRINKLIEELKKINEENEKLTEENEKLIKTNKDLNNKILKLQKNNEDLNSEKAKLQQDNNNEKAKLQQDNISLQRNIQLLQQQIRNYVKDYDVFKKKSESVSQTFIEHINAINEDTARNTKNLYRLENLRKSTMLDINQYFR